MEFKDYYRILGISPDSSEREIKDAYRKKASGSHPDKHPGGEGDCRPFHEIGEAYEVLGNTEKRKNYDRRYREEQRQREPERPASFSSGSEGIYFNRDSYDQMIDELFARFFGRSSRGSGRRESDGGRDYIHYDDLM
jgi:curved DNA-binding protein